MTTPKEIISKHVLGIQGIRIPFGRIIVENILNDLQENGYIVVEERTLRTLTNPKKEI